MASAKEHGIKNVEKVKRDKKRWRGKERRMHGRSSKIGKDGKKEGGGGGGGLSMWLCCFHVCVSAQGWSFPTWKKNRKKWILLCAGIGTVHDQLQPGISHSSLQ